ncbi:MAG: tetratricopeptide repeat protein [Selenomonadaceae bacterium]|nr:tetratricopeptide repeat protein [Selenomonadaceae bacterium]
MFGKKFWATLLVVGSLIAPNAAHAEIQTYTGVGEYVMGERDTLETAKQAAKDKALRNALERAGVLIQSRSRTEDSELVEDVITSQTGAVLQVVEVVYEREDLLIRATVKVDIDAEDLNRRLEAAVKPTADKISLSNQKLDEATQLWHDGQDDAALKLLSEAATLNPNNAEIFLKRAIICVSNGKFAQAADDANKVLQLKPNHSMALWIRGAAALTAGDNSAALADLNAAIDSDPLNKHAYYFRGIYFKTVGDKKRARADFLKAKELGYTGSVGDKFLEANP